MKKTGAQLILEVLLEHGVDTVFGYPGGAILNVNTPHVGAAALVNKDTLAAAKALCEEYLAAAAESCRCAGILKKRAITGIWVSTYRQSGCSDCRFYR